MKELMIYLKTTETCNLNCRHCFTSGSAGAKIYWDHLKVVDWLQRLRLETSASPHVHLEFHGGEPFLADLNSLQYVYNHCKDLWPSQSWGITTNLTFKLTEEQIKFIQGPLNNRIGTSWDPDIRFSSPKQYDLWRKNLQKLIDLGVTVKLFVSVTRGTVAMNPLDLLEWVRDLGVSELALERLTNNGNARQYPEIFPSNSETDAWLMKMHLQSEQAGARSWFTNELLETIYEKFESNNINSGTFCRDCEEKLFTVNADGTVAGCPNSAPEDYFGNINDSIKDLINNSRRIHNIACERSRDPRCYNCEVFNYCGGDCHQLEWEGNICPAPKTLMKSLGKNRKVWFIKEL